MKAKDKLNIIKKLSLPPYFIKKGTMAYYFVEEKEMKVLVGLCLNSVFDKEKFFIEYFVQPLFIPFDTFNLTIGKRIGNYWIKDNISLINKSLIFNKIDSFKNLLLWVKKNFDTKTIYQYQFLGYLYLLQDEPEKAILELKKGLEDINEIPEWKLVEVERIKTIINFIKINDNSSIFKLFQQWQNETIQKLKL